MRVEASGDVGANASIVLRGLFDGFPIGAACQFVPLLPGVSILPLYGRHSNGKELSPHTPSAALLRYEPGAVVPPHRHPGFEHIIVLQGAQADENGVYERGACLISPPGSQHRVTSEHGCLVLAIWHQGIEFLQAPTSEVSETRPAESSGSKPCPKPSTAVQSQ